MLDCMIIGDSIAVGVSGAMPHCRAYARTGYTTGRWINEFLPVARELPTRNTIISLSANDLNTINTESNLLKIRAQIRTDQVYWILPNLKLKPTQVQIVRKVAADFGDVVLERPTTDISGDGVHPTATGYRRIAEQLNTHIKKEK